MSSSLLRQWRAALKQADYCPYVGPRPQTDSDETMLIGRDSDLERITRAVLIRPLVVLHGYSGCGKSSLLQNGLYHSLRDARYKVLVAREWETTAGPFTGSSEEIENQVERYVAGAVKLTHDNPKGPIAVPEGIDLDGMVERGQLGSILDEEFRESAVLILDQFEELFRQHDGKTASAIVRWVVESGYRRRTHFLISLRTDSLHLLDPLLRGVKPFSMDRVFVPELTDPNDIEKVIRTIRSGSNITETAVLGLMRLWSGHEPRPRLLDLQSTLYALYFHAKTNSTGASASDDVTIDDRAVSTLEEGAGPGQDQFKFGLREAIRLKMDHAEDASRRAGLDEYLVCGAREMVRRAAPLFSSLDFKVPVDEIDLTRRVLERELGVLERSLARELQPGTSGDSKRLVHDTVAQMFAVLRKSDDFLLARRQATLTDGVQVPRRVIVTAGPMMGSTAAATLFEEIRRVVLAIDWLVASDIVRRYPGGTLLLVHDGSGGALRAWAKLDETGTGYALHRLTAARGEHYVWGAALIGGDEHAQYRVFANLNWRDCRISARFHHVVLVNCDFRGSQFEDCIFSGATFVNCLLDDANFEDCQVVGRVDLAPVPRQREEGSLMATRVAPSFTVETALSEVRSFAAYPPYPEVSDHEKAQYFSDTSNKPAKPGIPPSGFPGDYVCHFVTSIESPPIAPAVSGQAVAGRLPTSGGVVMLGGRLCMLTINRCTSVDGGSFAFHHVSGSGLDIVEQDGGSVDIHDAAIRGISVSRDPGSAADGGRPTRMLPIILNVDESFVANVYFSNDLVGSAAFQDSWVMMLVNASENTPGLGFTVSIKNSRYQFLVNTDDPDDSSVEDSSLGPELRYFHPIEGTDSRFETANRDALAEDLAKMDYRSHPEESEDVLRARRAQARTAAGRAPAADSDQR